MATRVRRRPTDGQGSKQVQNNGQRKTTQRRDEPAPLIPVLARRVREVEARVSSKGKASPTNRTKFLVVALLMRSERARVREDTSIPSATRADLLKRLDGIATILAQIAARDTSLLTLLDANAKPGPAAQQMRRDWLLESGAELAEEDLVITGAPSRRDPSSRPQIAARQVMPQSVPSRALANPFLTPDLGRAQSDYLPNRLAGWDLLSPLYRAFEQGAGGEAASMDLPPTPQIDRFSPPGLAAHGPPVALPPERPGGPPHLPARRRARPRQDGPVGHGRLDRRRLPDARRRAERREDQLGPRGRAVDAAAPRHRHPRRRQRRRRLRRRLRRQLRDPRPALRRGSRASASARWSSTRPTSSRTSGRSARSRCSPSATGCGRRRPAATRSSWPSPARRSSTTSRTSTRSGASSAGSRTASRPPRSSRRLDDTGHTPADRAFYPEARRAVIDMGIVRRRKVDVAKDLPDKRIADITVELDDDLGRSIREAERALGRRLAQRYRALLAAGRRARGGRRAGHRPHAPGRRRGAAGRIGREGHRQRLLARAPHRPGQVDARRRLRRAAVALGRQGRLLRQAHRRHGRGRARARLGGPAHRVGPR